MKTKTFTLSIASLAILSLLAACGPKAQAPIPSNLLSNHLLNKNHLLALRQVLVNHRRPQVRTLL